VDVRTAGDADGRHPSGGTLIASVRRALEIVDIVAGAARPVPVKVVAATTGLSLGTAYNLARTLVHEGYLASEPDGLVLGARFPALAAGAAAHDGLFLARVRPALHRVTGELGLPAYLSRYEDGEVRLVDVVEARTGPRVDLWVGMESSAHATALGKRILAELPVRQRADYLSRHPLAELTPHTVCDPRALQARLARETWMTVDREEYALGCVCVSVPVRAPGVLASLAVSLPARGRPRDVEEVGRSLRASAARLSLSLGLSPFASTTA